MSDILSWRRAWLEGSPLPSAPLSTGISLRRNLRRLPFPPRARGVELQEFADEVRDLLGSVPLLPGFLCLPLKQLGPLQRDLLRERRELHVAENADVAETLLVVEESGTLSLTMNDEDHLRFQALLPGLALEEALSEVMRLERGMERLGYAFDETLGYLTARGSDVGTGLRCAVTLHLPALTLTGALEKVTGPLVKEGMRIYPLEGESFRDASGAGRQMSRDGAALYDISYQATLGLSEGEIVERIHAFVAALRNEEFRVRELILAHQKGPLDDLCWRSYGVLRYARHLPLGEALRFLSVVRLGEELDILPSLGDGAWKRLLVGALPAHVRARGGDGGEERSRATFLRETLPFRR